MSRRIVVPVNETPRSERAIPVAAHLARAMGVPLALLGVRYWPTSEHPTEVGYHETLLRAYRDIDAESITVSAGGSIASAIATTCGPDDIVCMGVDHTSAVSELLVGSVFFEVVRTFHGPVVAVGPYAEVPLGANRLLLCLDGKEHAERGLDLLSCFAEPAHLVPFLVQAVDESAASSAGAESKDVAETGYLHRVAAGIVDRGGVARRDIGWDVLHGDAVKAIVSAASQSDVAFVGLATDAIDPVTRMLSPSLANELVRSCTRPLVLLSANSRVLRHKLIPREQPALTASGR